MQNVMPLFQRGMHFDHVVLLASGDETGKINARFETIASDMRCALKDRAEWTLWPTPVNPIDPLSTKLVCKSVMDSLPNDNRVSINFTGGLKPMSIGAYLAGKEYHIPMLYVDTQAEQFFSHDEGRVSPERFNFDPISVDTFLQIHGQPIRKDECDSLEKAEFTQIAKKIFENGDQSIEQLIHIQKQVRKDKRNLNKELLIRSYNEKRLPVLFSELEALGQLRRSGSFFYLSPSAARFINGDWLEDYVVLKLAQSGSFMDVCWRLKVAKVDNELDVACTINGKIGIIECKSGSLKGAKGQFMLSRLHALKETLGGTFGKTYLVTATPKEEISADLLNRANEYVSRIIDLSELPMVAEIIEHGLVNRSRLSR
jgi:hypothetical protein